MFTYFLSVLLKDIVPTVQCTKELAELLTAAKNVKNVQMVVKKGFKLSAEKKKSSSFGTYDFQ